MKKVYGLILSLTAMTFIGCSGDNDPNGDKFGNEPESGWVQFDAIATNVIAGAVTEFEVPVSLKAPVNTSGLTVNYTVADVEGTSEGFVYSGSVQIPKNTLTGNIHFTIPEATFNTCTKFEITLTSTSRSNVQVGLVDDVKPITHLVNVLSREALLGNYDVVNESYTVNVTAGELPNQLVVDNLLNFGGSTNIFLQEVAYIYPIEDDPLSEALGNDVSLVSYPSFTDNYLFTDTGAGDIYVTGDYEGIGGATGDAIKYSYFHPCNQAFELNFLLVDGNGTELGEGNVVMFKM